MEIKFILNGKKVSFDVPPMKSLLHVIREDAGLLGVKEGCGEGECGSCAILVDGILVNSCLFPVIQAHGKRVTTIEGVKNLKIEKAFLKTGAVQCGFCTPGMVMASLECMHKKIPFREGLAGNLCRCTGYKKILEVEKK